MKGNTVHLARMTCLLCVYTLTLPLGSVSICDIHLTGWYIIIHIYVVHESWLFNSPVLCQSAIDMWLALLLGKNKTCNSYIIIIIQFIHVYTCDTGHVNYVLLLYNVYRNLLTRTCWNICVRVRTFGMAYNFQIYQMVCNTCVCVNI